MEQRLVIVVGGLHEEMSNASSVLKAAFDLAGQSLPAVLGWGRSESQLAKLLEAKDFHKSFDVLLMLYRALSEARTRQALLLTDAVQLCVPCEAAREVWQLLRDAGRQRFEADADGARATEQKAAQVCVKLQAPQPEAKAPELAAKQKGEAAAPELAANADAEEALLLKQALLQSFEAALKRKGGVSAMQRIAAEQLLGCNCCAPKAVLSAARAVNRGAMPLLLELHERSMAAAVAYHVGLRQGQMELVRAARLELVCCGWWRRARSEGAVVADAAVCCWWANRAR